jgi:outer membrane protein assembly factor BamB
MIRQPAATSDNPNRTAEAREAHRRVYRTALVSAVVSGTFLALLGALLLGSHLHDARLNPLEPPEALTQARQTLSRASRDGSAPELRQELSERIRDLDLELRRSHFGGMAFRRFGHHLLLASAILFIAALRVTAVYRPGTRRPVTAQGTGARGRTRGLRSLAVVVVVALLWLGAVVAVLGFRGSWSPLAADLDSRLRGPVADEELATQWHRFRGPQGSGRSALRDLPLHWDEGTGDGILWKTPIPLTGASSPIVWKDQVFVTGGDERHRALYALDARRGDISWQHDCTALDGPEPRTPKVFRAQGYAASTPATDGRRVYAVFANGDVVATDLQGARVWELRLGCPDNQWGFASSLVPWRDRVFLLFDQHRRDPVASELIALDAGSGAVLWRIKRDVAGSWTTPILVDTPRGSELITVADPGVLAYDPETGRELWRSDDLGGFVAPSPIAVEERVFVAMQGYGIRALKAGVTPDSGKGRRLWLNDEFALPDVSSPVFGRGLVFTVSTSGALSSFDAGTGALVWQHELDFRTWVSPSIVGDHLLVLGQAGEVRSFAVAREVRETSVAALNDAPFYASPAIAQIDGESRLFVRGATHLYAIGRGAPARAAEAWTRFRGDAGSSGRVGGHLSLPLSLAWSAKPGAGIRSTPSLSRGRVFVGADDGWVRALSADDGRELWSFRTRGAVEAPLAVDGGLVLAGSSDGSLYALDEVSGELRWRYRTGDRILGGVNGDGEGRLVVGSYDGRLHGIARLDGSGLWTYLSDSYVHATPAVDGGQAVFGGCDGKLHVVDLKSGGSTRRLDLGSYVGASVAVDGGDAYVGNYQGEFVRVGLHDGKVRWTRVGSRQPILSSAALAEDRVVFGARDQELHCLARADGHELWAFKTRGRVDASPLVVGEVVLAASSDGRLYGLGLEDGRLLWSHDLGAALVASPVLAAGLLVVCGTDGHVWAFEASPGTLRRGSREGP